MSGTTRPNFPIAKTELCASTPLGARRPFGVVCDLCENCDADKKNPNVSTLDKEDQNSTIKSTSGG